MHQISSFTPNLSINLAFNNAPVSLYGTICYTSCLATRRGGGPDILTMLGFTSSGIAAGSWERPG